MRLFKANWFIGLVCVLTACAGSRSATSGGSSTDYNSYNEDLSVVRPVYASAPATPASRPEPTPAAPVRKPEPVRPTGPVETLTVNRQLDAVLDTLANKNRSIRYAPGYRVQVYVGTQRQKVEEAKLLIYQNFPELSPYLTYSQPTYKLKVGDFMRRMDADRYYSSIKQLIPSAQLQPDKVILRRSLLIK
jgi:hypothetical protein